MSERRPVPPQQSRSGVITLRFRGPDAATVREAATEMDHPVAVFIRSAAVREARRIIARRDKKSAA